MRPKPHPTLEAGRVAVGFFKTGPGERMGAFSVASPNGRSKLRVILSDGRDWAAEGLPPPVFEHASVTVDREQRCPTWEEMCRVKFLIWEPSETVIQYHPAELSYVNNHPHCLHLWKPVDVELPLPPTICVGVVKAK